MAKHVRIFDERSKPVAPMSAYARRFAALVSASRAVGYSKASQLRWVTKFIAEDPDRWNDATLADHADCLAIIGNPIPENCVGGIPLPAPLAPRDVRAMRQLINLTLTDAVKAPTLTSTPLAIDGVSVGLVRLTERGRKPARWALRYNSASPDAAVMRAVVDLVLAAGDRLVACRWCGAPIVAVKKQLFCDAIEAQRFRNQNRAKKGDRHAKTTRKG